MSTGDGVHSNAYYSKHPPDTFHPFLDKKDKDLGKKNKKKRKESKIKARKTKKKAK